MSARSAVIWTVVSYFATWGVALLVLWALPSGGLHNLVLDAIRLMAGITIFSVGLVLCAMFYGLLFPWR